MTAIDKDTLTKGQLRKLTALRRSAGDEPGEEVFAKWLVQQASAAATKADPVAVKIEEALAGFAKDRSFNLGVYGYTIRRARGKGASGLVATKTKRYDRDSWGSKDQSERLARRYVGGSRRQGIKKTGV